MSFTYDNNTNTFLVTAGVKSNMDSSNTSALYLKIYKEDVVEIIEEEGANNKINCIKTLRGTKQLLDRYGDPYSILGLKDAKEIIEQVMKEIKPKELGTIMQKGSKYYLVFPSEYEADEFERNTSMSFKPGPRVHFGNFYNAFELE